MITIIMCVSCENLFFSYLTIDAHTHKRMAGFISWSCRAYVLIKLYMYNTYNNQNIKNDQPQELKSFQGSSKQQKQKKNINW